MRKQYPLQLTISSLFIIIILTLGLLLSWQSFTKTSAIMLDSADRLYQNITRELTLEFNGITSAVSGGLSQVRLSGISRAQTYAERMAYLPAFKAVLDSNVAVFTVGVGYADGDYLGFSSVASDYMRARYSPPTDAAYIVLYLNKNTPETGFDADSFYSVYLDKKLNEIGRGAVEKTDFDPRTRSWYQQATEVPSATKPYLFYSSQIVGLSAMTKTVEPGVVVVFDITLESLSEAASRYQVTQNSEVVLINAQGQTFTYKDQTRVVRPTEDGSFELANLKNLGSGVLAHLSQWIEVKEQDLDFSYNDRRWIGSTRIVAKPGGVDLYALMLSPVDELLVDANAIRWNLQLLTLVILSVFIPLVWYVSRRISRPLNMLAHEAEAIARFEFDETQAANTIIKEVTQLDDAMQMMKSTINKFIKLINSLAGEQDLDKLLKSITVETMLISQSDAALIYLLDEHDDMFKADFICDSHDSQLNASVLPDLTLQQMKQLLQADENGKSRVFSLKRSDETLSPLLALLQCAELTCIVLPLENRNGEIIGLLCLIYRAGNAAISDASNIDFVEALSGFAAVTLESRQLFYMQEALLHAFIKLIAGAIDAKSPYTGGHCQRVPEITMMLAKAACDSESVKYRDFDLDEKQWQELNIACWLHDCGKVTTPEFVVDKATKLETIYDRIHEIRMRFEVLKRDAEIDCWQQIAEGGDRQKLLDALTNIRQTLDDDFAFIAECNVGGEFMADDKIARLSTIAEKTWLRTLDDSLGLSWEERDRKNTEQETLPVEEKLLADKPEHLIVRHENDRIPEDNRWGFKVDTPEYKYNRGELYNLSIKSGTLSAEDRYIINGHMIQTIIMLNNLPYPKYLRDVPLIAGSHHETMDGRGYPKKLIMSEQPLTSRMMVIADIFEALTASDRPYKKAKSLSEALRILSFMRNDNHIDADLFELFLNSGVYLHYAKKYLSPEQIDEVDISDYLP